MVPVIGAVVVLVATKLGMPVALPALEAAKPIAVLLFVQVYVVVPPVFVVEKLTAVVLPVLQTTSSAIALTWAVGLTIIVLVNELVSISVPNWIWEINKTTLFVGLGTVIVPVPAAFNKTVWLAPPSIE